MDVPVGARESLNLGQRHGALQLLEGVQDDRQLFNLGCTPLVSTVPETQHRDPMRGPKHARMNEVVVEVACSWLCVPGAHRRRT